MTESKKIFCESVARLCNMAGCPELYAPIVKIASLCEADEVQANADTENTTMANIDLNKLPQEELDSLILKGKLIFLFIPIFSMTISVHGS